jgi:hypothetical protein
LSRSQLFLKAQDFCLQRLDLHSLSIKLPLQPAALWTGLPCLMIHDPS